MSMSSKVLGIFCSAIAITVLFILPAEYGYDPSGIGEKVGLLKLSESSVTINDEDSTNNKPKGKSNPYQCLGSKYKDAIKNKNATSQAF